ncbi:MAG: nitronate monooxygenase, partial [Proteobacteria bacterium]|nr:nitronate monooxygenase [Pseudomonadota bacterium]
MARLHTPLCDILGTRLPIIQAPMAGGPSSPELVTAASAAGALGSFGFAYTQPDEMKRQAAAVRAKTDRPFGINLFGSPLPGDVPDNAQRDALAAVAAYYTELGLPPPEPVRAPYGPDFDAQLAAVAEIRPRVFTVHLNELSAERIARLKATG